MRAARILGVLSLACLAAITGCLPQTPPPQPDPPTGALDPTATATPGGARIDSFTVSPAEAYPGDTVTLKWQTTGGFGVEINKLLPIDTYVGPYTALPATGELQVTLDEDDRNKVTFVLDLATAGDTLKGQAEVKVLCPLTWFFEGGPAKTCPQWPAGKNAGQGVAQKFEHGQVIWSGGDRWAVVLYEDADGGWERVYGEWAPGQPESDPALIPPEGLFQPVRQIGMAWRTETIPGHPPRERLGWATAPEVPVATNFQCDSYYYFYPDVFMAPCYISGIDGQIIQMADGWKVWNAP